MKALVTRPREDAAPLLAALAARGIDSVLAPMLTIGPAADAAVQLPGALTGVQAVLFTSANGVRAFAAASSRFDLPAFCVGPASAAAARIAGFRAVCSADGDVADLAELAASRLAPHQGALLHAAGAIVAGDLAAALGARGFVVRRVMLYHTDAAEQFEPEVSRALQRGEIAMALFFSPRSAETFVRLARNAGISRIFAKMTAFALSPNVAKALEALAWRAIFVAAAPHQDALLQQIDAFLTQGAA